MKIKKYTYLILLLFLSALSFSEETEKNGTDIKNQEIDTISEEIGSKTENKKKGVFEIRRNVDEISEKDKKIGIALGGGSAKGLAHIGILKVMEEEKVPIEYVTGTSMGSIIGGLYAAGYTAKEIEKISIEMDWIKLFNEKIERKEKGITRNLIEDRNTTVLPMEGLMPKLPSGAIGGKSASENLNELFQGVLDINDFRKFPKKFAAVGTDLNTGEGVMIDKGSIATAIRSSISLPSIFNPVQVDDRLFVDGGVTRNLPVQDVKVLGADYTIGINVGEGFEKRDPEKLNIIGVISDSMTIAGRQEVERQVRMLDMYIAPALEGIESQDFMKAKDIIAKGEKIARDHIEEIRKLSNPEKFEELERKRIEFRNSWKNEYEIKSVEIKGNKKYKEDYFDKYIPKKLGKMKKEELQEIVNDLYRNGNFSTVYYEIKENNKLVIHVQEKAGNYLTTSTNINNEDYASVNVGVQGNKNAFNNVDMRYQLKFTAANEYGVDGTAIMSTGKDNRILAIGKFNYKRDLIKNQYLNGNKFEYENKKFKSSLGMGFELNRDTMILFSGGYQISDVSRHLDEDKNKKIKFPYFEAEITHDNRDSIVFPKNGTYFKTVYTLANSKEADFDSLYAKGEVNIPITKKLTLTPRVSYVTSKGEKIPETYSPKLGGFQESDYSMEFLGIPSDKFSANSIFIGEIKLQYQLSRLLFADANASFARMSEKAYVFGDNKKESYGLGIGAKLPIGPIYFRIAKSPKESIRYFFNIGYQPKAFNE